MPPKKRNRKRAPNRMSTRRPIPETVRAGPELHDTEAESELADRAAAAGAGDNFLAELREAVDARHPLELLHLASTILSGLDPRDGSRADGAEEVSVSVFADALLAVGARQTDALASVIGAMSGEDMLRERIRREVLSAVFRCRAGSSGSIRPNRSGRAR